MTDLAAMMERALAYKAMLRDLTESTNCPDSEWNALSDAECEAKQAVVDELRSRLKLPEVLLNRVGEFL